MPGMRRMRMEKKRALWLLSMAVTILTMALIFGFSGQSAAESSALSGGLTARVLPLVQAVFPGVSADGLHHFLRKAAHFTVYFVLGCGLTGDFSAQKRVPPVLCAVAVGALFAASDELHQLFSEGRAASVRDVLLDTSGVAAGSLLSAWAGGLFAKKRT